MAQNENKNLSKFMGRCSKTGPLHRAKTRGELLESWIALRAIMKPFACELDPAEMDRCGRKRTRRN